MTRTFLSIYLVVVLGVGPRACCVASDAVDAGARILVAATHPKCCATPCTLPTRSGESDPVPGRCHNLPPVGVEASKSAPPASVDFAIVTLVPAPRAVVASFVRYEDSVRPGVWDRLSRLQILRC